MFILPHEGLSDTRRANPFRPARHDSVMRRSRVAFEAYARDAARRLETIEDEAETRRDATRRLETPSSMHLGRQNGAQGGPKGRF